MGANIVNTMCEAIAPTIEKLTRLTALVKIVTNYATERLATASTIWKKETITPKTIEAILDAQAFAQADVARACTHNKGIMNGIDAVLLATGNDFRAVEAGAHAFASRTGSYQPLTHYYKNEENDLVGQITIPIAVGIVGGSTTINPVSRVNLKILNIASAQELAMVIACDWTTKFAALRTCQ